MSRWLHRPTGTAATLVGHERDASGVPYAVMQTDDGARAMIDPTELVRVGGDWTKESPAPNQEQQDG